jgi:dynein heavy chain
MIYLDTAILGPKSLTRAWLKHEMPVYLDKPQKQKIELLCGWLLEPCLEFVTKNCDQFVHCSKMHLTINFLKLYSVMLEEMK